MVSLFFLSFGRDEMCLTPGWAISAPRKTRLTLWFSVSNMRSTILTATLGCTLNVRPRASSHCKKCGYQLNASDLAAFNLASPACEVAGGLPGSAYRISTRKSARCKPLPQGDEVY